METRSRMARNVKSQVERKTGLFCLPAKLSGPVPDLSAILRYRPLDLKIEAEDLCS